ncbi:MAG: PQQ-dependent sugar dehydrogenase [Chloroflexota bacterium]
MKKLQAPLWLILLSIFLTACDSADTEAETPSSEPVEVIATEEISVDLDLPDGFLATALPYDFDRPTQFVVQNNLLWVAQLAGGENAELGEIVLINMSTGEKSIVIDGLDKPTGLAVINQTVWVAERDSISKIDLISSIPSKEVILSNLPNNGRSNGTLTVLPSGEIMYETSGNRTDIDSGKLWALNPADGSVRVLASGLKGAYAHTITPNGQIWFTEVVDGSLQGVPYPDEINLLEEGADYGWPECYGRELAGTDCEGVKPALTTFDAGSTPTGIAFSPFGDESLFVARWVSGDVVQIDTNTGEFTSFVANLGNPQHIISLDDGSLMFSDYAAGEIYQVVKTE